MPTNYDFASKYKESTDASYLMMDYLMSKGKQVIDLTDDDDAQSNGYDFTVDGEWVEFKSDTKTHITGNIAFELISNLERQHFGCLVTSNAKWLLYYELATGVCHKILLPALIQAIKHCDILKWQVAKVATTNKKGQTMYFGFSLLVPIAFMNKYLTKEEYMVFSIKNYLDKRDAEENKANKPDDESD